MQLGNKKKKSFRKHQYDKKHEPALLHLTLSLMLNFREHMKFIFGRASFRKHWMWFFFFLESCTKLTSFN